MICRSASKDPDLEATYVQLLKQSSPHEKAILRDLGRFVSVISVLHIRSELFKGHFLIMTILPMGMVLDKRIYSMCSRHILCMIQKLDTVKVYHSLLPSSCSMSVYFFWISFGFWRINCRCRTKRRSVFWCDWCIHMVWEAISCQKCQVFSCGCIK